MVAVSFGSYAGAAVGAEDSAFATKAFAALLVVAMSVLNAFGSQAVARVQSIVVVVVIGILSCSRLRPSSNAEFTLLAPSGYPPLGDIVGSVALTFFAFLGFGVITFTAAHWSSRSDSFHAPCTWRSGSRR